jgi:hypothetical protein
LKKILSVIAGSLLFLSVTAFAEEHLNAALEHANAAVTEGKAGSAPKLAVHAKAALDHSLAASLVAKSVSKNHIDAASKSLQQAIDHAALSHVQPATKASEEAVTHLSAAKK